MRSSPPAGFPGVDAGNHAVSSFEALIRWNHPERGIVGPNEFIPVAERSTLIAKIDRWVLNSAAAQLAAWTTNPAFSQLPVAVNISGRHLGSGSLFGDVMGALNNHEVDPSRLLLEVTETALLIDLDMAARELAQLRDAGVRVALDDFGTGYMSLSHLRGLPVDVLKIDQFFVAEMVADSDHPLIRLIVDTRHLLGVEVTAEGVETSMQADALTEMGVDSLQGFLFGKPLESAEIQANETRAAA
jgi:EAL domain-containing protein (putative c-di-GMP-specific phosphodiesterase class I)